jgi:hypothetical protein
MTTDNRYTAQRKKKYEKRKKSSAIFYFICTFSLLPVNSADFHERILEISIAVDNNGPNTSSGRG